MTKAIITKAALTSIIYRRVKDSSDIPDGMKFQVVSIQSPDAGWAILTNPEDRAQHPEADHAFRAIQAELREEYDLATT